MKVAMTRENISGSNGQVVLPLETPGQAINTINVMKSEFDKAFVGEEAAKYAVINTLAIGSNLALGGKAGAGKSSLVRGASRIVGLDYDSEVAFVPGSPELRSYDVIGGKVEQDKKIISNGETRREVISNYIIGAFDENTVLGHFEELTAANVRAIRASMSIFGDRYMETNAGRVYLKKLVAVFASMNAARRIDGTNQLPAQVMDRMTFGVLMGQTPKSREQRKAENMAVAAKPDRPELLIEPVVTIEKVSRLGAYMLQEVTIDDKVKNKLHDIVIDVADYLHEAHSVVETDRRLAKKMGINAKAYGARNAEQIVKEADIFDATRSVIAARLAPKESAMDLDIDAVVSDLTKL